MTNTETYISIGVVIVTIVATLIFFNPRKKQNEEIYNEYSKEEHDFYGKRPTEQSWRDWYESQLNNKN